VGRWSPVTRISSPLPRHPSPVPFLDTTKLHVEQVVARLLQALKAIDVRLFSRRESVKSEGLGDREAGRS